MIVLRTPKGWTGPREVDGKPMEGTWRAHQVPLAGLAGNPEHLAQLEQWLQSYRPEELFDGDGRPRPELAALAPRGARRMGANPHANGGALLRDLRLPDFRRYAVAVPGPGAVDAEATRVLGTWLRDVMRENEPAGTSASSVPTRRPPTGSTPCSRSTGRTWLGETDAGRRRPGARPPTAG